MGIIKGNNAGEQLNNLSFQIRESYKMARTSIAYSIIKKGCKKVAFTSSTKGEGKTITSTNIAVALAQQVGTRVLIIDCDLRRPRVHSAINIEPFPGLANYLNEECQLDDIIKDTGVDNLSAICFGAIPPNPSELLSSDSMHEMIKELEKRFDYIIFDTPPVNVVIDAVPMIKESDGVVIVVRDKTTTYANLNRTKESILRAGGKILGVIINRVKSSEAKKGYYYQYK